MPPSSSSPHHTQYQESFARPPVPQCKWGRQTELKGKMQSLGPPQPPVPSFPGEIKMQVRQCEGKGAGIPSTTWRQGREMQAGAATPEVVLGRGAVTGGGVKGFSVPAHCPGPSPNLAVHGKGEYVPCSFTGEGGNDLSRKPSSPQYLRHCLATCLFQCSIRNILPGQLCIHLFREPSPCTSPERTKLQSPGPLFLIT